MQIVLRDRADWALHVMFGGALIIIADAVLAGLTTSGPLDPADVTYTLAWTSGHRRRAAGAATKGRQRLDAHWGGTPPCWS